MRLIPLTQNQFALVNHEDFLELSKFKWCYSGGDGRTGYAVRHIKVNGIDRLLYLHQQIHKPEPGQEVIFLNNETLDCRRQNLKSATKEEALRHHHVRSDSQSVEKGLSYNPVTDQWSAYAYHNGHCYHIITCYSRDEAIGAYEAELKK